MARPRVDPELKALRGTKRKDREPKAAPTAIVGPMVAPVPLTPRAITHFDAIAGMLARENRASQHFAYTVAVLALRLDQAEQLQTVIVEQGHTVESRSVRKTKDGGEIETYMVRARPEVAMLADALRHIQALLSELMLSPTAAQRIARPDTPKGNSFADL